MQSKSNINRREFIKNVGAGTGLLVSAAGFPLSSLTTEKPVRLGFVGVGGRGIGMLKIALALEGVEVVAILDRGQSGKSQKNGTGGRPVKTKRIQRRA